MDVTTIKNEEEYLRRLDEMESLVDADPQPGTDDFERMQLIGLVLADYENRSFPPIPATDPIDAIRFIMAQNDLSPKDLVPYFGSATRVSEVLNKKRLLSKEMIRKLHAGLGIPAEVLLRDYSLGETGGAFSRFPFREMARRGWFAEKGRKAEEAGIGLMESLIARHGLERRLQPAHHRRTASPDSAQVDGDALQAWQYLVLCKAKRIRDVPPFKPEALNDAFLRPLRSYSARADGPRLAVDALRQVGIIVVFEQHFSKTRLDGAATALPDGNPVIGMTLRHDRVDNFWFVLFHELAHVALHIFDAHGEWFIDDLDHDDGGERESEADAWALERLVPASDWQDFLRHPPFRAPMVRKFAKQQGVAPAIVAGRLRRELGNYRILSTLVGYGAVRPLFEEELKAAIP